MITIILDAEELYRLTEEAIGWHIVQKLRIERARTKRDPFYRDQQLVGHERRITQLQERSMELRCVISEEHARAWEEREAAEAASIQETT